jgi:hypothetical protein
VLRGRTGRSRDRDNRRAAAIYTTASVCCWIDQDAGLIALLLSLSAGIRSYPSTQEAYVQALFSQRSSVSGHLRFLQQAPTCYAYRQAGAEPMPKGKKLNARDKRQLKAAELQLFVQATGRKAEGNGADPNDRRVDRRVTKAVRHMHPTEFDRLIRGEDE